MNTEDVFILRPLPHVKGCRWMTYHFIVHTSYAHENENEQTNDNVLELGT